MPIWRFDFKTPTTISSVLPLEDRFIMVTNEERSIIAVNAFTGALLWNQPLPALFGSSIYPTANPITTTDGKTTIRFIALRTLDNNFVFVLNAADGSIAYNSSINAANSPQFYTNGTNLISCQSNTTATAPTFYLSMMSLLNGTVIWNLTVSGGMGSNPPICHPKMGISFHNNTAFAGFAASQENSGQRFVVIDLTTGKRQFLFTAGGNFVSNVCGTPYFIAAVVSATSLGDVLTFTPKLVDETFFSGPNMPSLACYEEEIYSFGSVTLVPPVSDSWSIYKFTNSLPSPSPTSPASPPGKGNLSPGAVVGIAIGGSAVCLLIVFGAVKYFKARNELDYTKFP